MLSIHPQNAEAYPIHIGTGLLNDLERLIVPKMHSTHLVCLTNPLVKSLLGHKLDKLSKHIKLDYILVEDGESHKNLASFQEVLTQLLELGALRDTTLITLGGGVIGDLGGFVAGCYQRGIDYIQLPTTLLAQVDSSVGGKTAVNHPRGKNMIGLFYHPRAVVIDIDALTSLGTRHFNAGLAEIIKYGLIADADFFTWVADNIENLQKRDPQALRRAITRSCEIKAQIIEKDCCEATGGMRMLLNLGHTFAHAIETSLGPGEWLHGEAVGCGLVMATKLSALLGLVGEDTLEKISCVVQQCSLPTQKPASLSCKTLMQTTTVDKKNRDGSLQFIVLKNIGKAQIVSNPPPNLVRIAIGG